MIKKMLFLGDSNQTHEFLQQAKVEGFYTIVTDYNEPEYSTAKLEADEYWMISTGDIDALEQKCREENIQAVISGASDFNIEMAIRLCERLGLPSYCTEEVWNTSKDKVIFKRLCREAGVPVPTDYEVSTALSESELDSVVFPVMVKPIDLCSNFGVSYCYNKTELVKAYRYAESLSKSDTIIVERMLSGIEFVSYYVMAEGEAAFLTLGVRIPQPGEPKYCYSMNTTINSFTEQYLQEMNSAVIKLLHKIGCYEGIACMQCMLDRDGHFYAIEMCYCPEASLLVAPLRKVCDFDAISWQFDCAIGKKHQKSQLPQILGKPFDRCANSYILFSNKEGIVSEMNGLDAIDALPNVELCMHVHIGDKIKKYYPLGNIMFDTDDCNQVCEIIEYINENVEIKNTSGENVLIYFTDFDFIREEYQKSGR